MIKYILFLSFLIPQLSHADFGTGLLLGTMLSSGPKTTKVEIKDEFAKQVEQIEHSLPSSYDPVTQPQYSFSVIPQDSQRYLNYFKNGGYAVSYKKGVITFDLSSRHNSYLQTQARRAEEQKVFNQKWEANKPIFKNIFYLVLGFLVFISLIKAIADLNKMGILGWFYQTEMKLIKKILENTRKK